MITELVMVGVGGGIGALIRLSITNYCKSKYYGAYIPFWTMLINLIGAWCLALFVRINLENSLYLFLGMGGLGGFTTFSTFNYELACMLRDKEYKRMAIYFFITYGLALDGGLLIIGV